MKVYAINFNTLHYGTGIALAIASNPNEAFAYLKAQGRYNATPTEYQLVSCIEVSCATIDTPTLVYEDVEGVKIIVGPKGESGAHPYISLERIKDYLYRVTFDSLPKESNPDFKIAGACSSYVKDGKLYRNLDFYYDEAASFIVRTKDFEGISFTTGLNDGALTDDLIAQLPYRIVDGRNNNGIMVSTHVLFNDWEWNGCGNKNIPLTKLPFLVLSRVKSMATIAEDLSGILNNLYAPSKLSATEYLLQILVTDGTTTYAILPPLEANLPFVLQDITTNPKLTNFRWKSTPTVQVTDLQLRPTGVERFNLMPCKLSDLRFTEAYEEANRLSEFIGINNTTKDSSIQELTAIYEKAREIYLERKRDGVLWQTMHSVVYGDNGIEELYTQEDWNNNIIVRGVQAALDTKEDKPFVAIGGVTTFAEIKTAYDTGKNIIAIYDGYTYPLISCTNSRADFLRINGTTIYELSVTGSIWMESSTPFASKIYVDFELNEKEDKHFTAIYGETSNQDIYQAYTEGKTIFCKYLTKWGMLTDRPTSGNAKFYIMVSATKIESIRAHKVGDATEWEHQTFTLAEAQDLTTGLATKVDKVTGKGLSTNDYTNADMNKVANVPDDTNAALLKKEDKILVALAERTSFATILTAWNAGKQIFCKDEYDRYFNLAFADGDIFTFSRVDGDILDTWELTTDGWEEISIRVESKRFVATYNTTTYEEIAAAYTLGKTITCEKEGTIYPLVALTEDAAVFSVFDGESGEVTTLVTNPGGDWTTDVYTYLDMGHTAPKHLDAVYGETTYTEILNAHNNGQLVRMTKALDKAIYYISGMFGGKIHFTGIYNGTISECAVDESNQWEVLV